jgi:hypothetical protein
MATKQELENKILFLEKEISNLRCDVFDLRSMDNIRIRFGNKRQQEFSLGFGLDDNSIIKVYFEKSISIIPNASNSFFIKV